MGAEAFIKAASVLPAIVGPPRRGKTSPGWIEVLRELASIDPSTPGLTEPVDQLTMPDMTKGKK